MSDPGHVRMNRHVTKESQMHPPVSALVISVEDAATLLSIGRTLAYQEAKAGRLPGVFRIGRLYRVSVPTLYHHIGVAWPADETTSYQPNLATSFRVLKNECIRQYRDEPEDSQ
jgi:excisionase family DNA binding protein